VGNETLPGVIALHSVSGEAEEEGEGDRQEERHPHVPGLVKSSEQNPSTKQMPPNYCSEFPSYRSVGEDACFCQAAN
jgi:hypothetical protein